MNYSSFNTCQQSTHESNHQNQTCMKKLLSITSHLLICIMEQVFAKTIKKEKEVMEEMYDYMLQTTIIYHFVRFGTMID